MKKGGGQQGGAEEEATPACDVRQRLFIGWLLPDPEEELCGINYNSAFLTLVALGLTLYPIHSDVNLINIYLLDK